MKGKTGKMGKVDVFNDKGGYDEKEADDTTPEFKKGGAAKKKMKDGGHAKGKMPKHRLDRKPRAAGGRSPYTSAESVSGGAADDTEGKKDVTGPGAEVQIPVYAKGGRTK